MELQTLDPKPLRVFSNDRDLLRDLFIYLDYIHEHSVKRMTRTNDIPRADLVRIAKLLEIDPPQKDEWIYDRPHWIDFIDTLALQMQLVSYDLKGEYRGYTSSEPSFIENFITVNDTGFNKFLALSPAEQEKRILETLIRAKSRREYDNYTNNEFFQNSVLGELDSFSNRGAATGVVSRLKFPGIRLFLLDLLKKCPAGQWFSTESFVGWLKANHLYFLIPEELPAPKNKWETIGSRYDNFYEGKDVWASENTVPADASDGFERVEGRYVERFLENIPLTMRFVDVAYDPEPYKGLLPTQGILKGFRVNENFLRLMSGEESQPRLTVQPNFDVVIESDFYPAKIVQQVAALGELASSPNSGQSAYVGTFQLMKTFVAAEQVRQPDLDVIALLERLSGRGLPPNVKVELEEWSGHADQFILYEGFSLLESVEEMPESGSFIVERIAPTLRLVRAGKQLFSILEANAYAPLLIQHPAGGFAPLTESAISLFPKKTPEENVPRKPQPLVVSRSVAITMKFPDDESFDAFRKTLAELRCPFQSDLKTRAISFDQQFQAKFDEAIQQLRGTFVVQIE